MMHATLLIALLAADGGGGDGGAADCRRTTAEFGIWLQAVVAAAAEAPLFPGKLGVRLVGFQGSPARVTPLVEIVPGRIFLDGAPPDVAPADAPFAAQLSALERGLARLARWRAALGPRRAVDGLITVAVDRDVVWSEVAPLAGVLARAGYSQIDWAFAVQRTKAAARPPRSSVDEELASLASIPNTPYPGRTVKLVEITKRVLDRCPEMLKAMSELAGHDPEHTSASLAEKAAAAVAACRCAVDMDALEAVLYAGLDPAGGDPFTVVSFPLAPSAGRGARPLKAAASARWSAAYKQVVDAARASGATRYRLVTR